MTPCLDSRQLARGRRARRPAANSAPAGRPCRDHERRRRIVCSSAVQLPDAMIASCHGCPDRSSSRSWLLAAIARMSASTCDPGSRRPRTHGGVSVTCHAQPVGAAGVGSMRGARSPLTRLPALDMIDASGAPSTGATPRRLGDHPGRRGLRSRARLELAACRGPRHHRPCRSASRWRRAWRHLAVAQRSAGTVCVVRATDVADLKRTTSAPLGGELASSSPRATPPSACPAPMIDRARRINEIAEGLVARARAPADVADCSDIVQVTLTSRSSLGSTSMPA